MFNGRFHPFSSAVSERLRLCQQLAQHRLHLMPQDGRRGPRRRLEAATGASEG